MIVILLLDRAQAVGQRKGHALTSAAGTQSCVSAFTDAHSAAGACFSDSVLRQVISQCDAQHLLQTQRFCRGMSCIQLEVQEQLVGLRDHQPAALALRSLFCLFEATIEQDVMWGLEQPCQTLLLCC